MKARSALMASSPWSLLGNYKYCVLLPLLGKALQVKLFRGVGTDTWCFHILLISFLRCCVHQLWQMYSRSYFLIKKRQIQRLSVDYEQVDREFHWDDYIILQAWIATVLRVLIPHLQDLPMWNSKGIAILVLLHMGPAELVYYYVHRALHQGDLYTHYHSVHHTSTRPEPATAGTSTFLEQLVTMGVMCIPIIGVSLMEEASIGMFYAYFLAFDFLKNMLHSNVEVVPLLPFKLFPFLRYFLITPSYHTAHHTDMNKNFCLFVPFYDYLGGTVDEAVHKLHAIFRTKGQEEVVPDIAFLCHGVDLISSLHVGNMGRTFSSVPYSSRWFAWIFWPLTWPGLLLVWVWGKPYVIGSYVFKNIRQQTWAIPRLGFQYFLPFALNNINKLIEEAILEADEKGVKVITLGALNKNEAMNGGGALFVSRHKDLRVRVCHGNTMTTAVLLNRLPKDLKEVFLTGATSKIGKAVALYLCRKRVRVLMLTASRERFNVIVKEASYEFQEYLIHVTKYQTGQNCKTWIVGKWAGYNDQKWAPSGTHFHQFTMPEIIQFRGDCSYGTSAGLRVPPALKGMSTCEYTMPRRVIYACHAGGLIHALEGWEDHEVGPVDVNRIDIVWEAALKHGFSLV